MIIKSVPRALLTSFILLLASSLTLHETSQTTNSELSQLHHILNQLESQSHYQLKMTTRQLTLNLSGITFPNPAKYGDNLNLSNIIIPTASKCPNGYIVKEGKCRLVDLLLMQDLQVKNIILGSLSLEQLKSKQKEFINSNPNFTPLKCQGETPFLSKQGCIKCPDLSPYFNLQTLKCSKCPAASSYNPQIRNCQKGTQTNNRISDDDDQQNQRLREKWTIQKGLGNIFGWNKAASLDMIDRARDTKYSNFNDAQKSTTVTTTTTKTSNRSIRKQTDPEDQANQQDAKSGEGKKQTSSSDDTPKDEVASQDQK